VDVSVAARQERAMYVNVAGLTESQVNWVVLALFGVLGIGFVAACGRRPGSAQERAVEYSMAVVLTVLVSALAWTYFFVMLLLPVTTAIWLLRTREGLRPATPWVLRAALWGLAAATVLLWPAARPTQYVRAVGSLCWAALALFVGLALARIDLRRARGSG
jgi:hypothetical protein